MITDDTRTNHPSDGDVELLRKAVDRLALITLVAEADLQDVPKVLKSNGDAVTACGVTVPPCAACAAYKKDPAEAPYTMYHVKGHPEYYLDCLHCPVCFVLGECSSDGSAWRGLYAIASSNVKNGKEKFMEASKAAAKKLKSAITRWS